MPFSDLFKPCEGRGFLAAGLISFLSGCFGFVVWLFLFLGGNSDESYRYRDRADPAFSLSTDQYDLGESLRQMQKHTATFQIMNRGIDEIRILRFQVDCGCTAVLSDSSLLAPGQATHMTAAVSMGTTRGRFARTCTVFYQHATEAVARKRRVMIVGAVIPEFDVSPQALTFDRSAPQSQLISFKARPGAQLDLAVNDISAAGLSAKRIQSSAEDGTQRVEIVFDPNSYTGGQGTASVSFATGNSVEPVYRLPIAFR